MHPEMHTGAPGQQKGQDRVSRRRRISWAPPRKGMCRSEGVLGEPPETLRASVVRLCPAGRLSWRLLPLAAGQRELGIVSGDSGRRKKSDFQEQSILSLVHRKMFATGGCRQLEKSVDYSLPRAKAWSPCLGGPCRCGVSSRSGVPCAGCGKPL